MKVTRFNPNTDESVTLDLDIENHEWAAYQAGIKLEFAAPRLNAGERIWLKTGIPWDEFKKELLKDPTPQQKLKGVYWEGPTQYFPDSL